jgi:hypothetical protein
MAQVYEEQDLLVEEQEPPEEHWEQNLFAEKQEPSEEQEGQQPLPFVNVL